jgi:hypothetical protein
MNKVLLGVLSFSFALPVFAQEGWKVALQNEKGSAWQALPTGSTQQLINPAVRMREEPLQNVFEIDPRIVSVQLGRLHQTHHDGSALPRQFAAAEEPCFAFMRSFA